MTEPATLDEVRALAEVIRGEVAKAIVGQTDVVEHLLIALFARGHVLLEGPPGTAKTFLAQSLSAALGLQFGRIQFTPDLMPGDILGSNLFNFQTSAFTLTRGPIFCELLLADEINRTPPKTQAALLEAMQEHQVTAAGVRYPLTEPFFVLATQNPIEMEGTYPLPEAQLDRFMFNVFINYLPEDDEVQVVKQTTARGGEPIQALFTGEDVLRFHDVVRRVPVAEDVIRMAVKLAAASRPKQAGTPDFVNQFVGWGAGTRAAQNLVLGGKARALLQGRAHVTPDDIKALAVPVLRHRILVNYRAEAEGISVENIVERLLALGK